MESTCIQTKYGLLKGVARADESCRGTVKEYTLTEESVISTPYGDFIPQYEDDGVRRRFTYSLTFYQSGALRSVSLQNPAEIQTGFGPIACELVTFYESGAVKRLFPLNGKLSGFWGEKNEYDLAPKLNLDLPFGRVCVKPISFYFYESGEIKSLTVWPAEHVTVPTLLGDIPARTGVSFFETGAVKSLEPLLPTPVDTPIGKLTAFDSGAQGICADKNSLCFHPDGSLAALKTERNQLEVTADGKIKRYSPKLRLSHFSDDFYQIDPMLLAFDDGYVFINDLDLFELSRCGFSLAAFEPNIQISADCAGCGTPFFG
jgi:hypothetical protein